ncbi:MAG TPA: hypothetical protein VG142_08510 [Trebonia sp.]|jgi:hypothetical protein|nr:hypothetical protein [Trebonia sp.]
MSHYKGRPPYVSEDQPPETTTFHLENVNLRRLTGADKVAAIASFLLLISLFLPWYGVSAGGATVTLSGTGVHRFLWLAVLLTVVTLTYLIVHATVGLDRTPMNRFSHEPVLLVITLLQLALVVYPFFDVPDTLIKGVTVNFQYGSFIGLIAAITAVVTVIAPFIRSRRTNR